MSVLSQGRANNVVSHNALLILAGRLAGDAASENCITGVTAAARPNQPITQTAATIR